MKLSIVIPNFNGSQVLARHLPSVVRHSHGAEVILVDDASTDHSPDWVKKKFPQVKVLINPKNLGFARSVNRGFSQAKGDLVLLLNSDVSINQTTISRLIPHFHDNKVFAVGSLEKLPKGSRRGKSTGHFQRGLLVHSKANSLKRGPTLWVFGASGMFQRSIWGQLGGLDPLFHPAYYEDIDICYRAWKAGFKCLFEPRATVDHDAEVTLNKALGSKKATYVFKNQLLFHWKNISSPWLIFQHLLWLPYHLTFTTFKTKGAFLFGFIYALINLSSLRQHRQKLPNLLTDQQVIYNSTAL